MAMPCSAESILDRDVLAPSLITEAASEDPRSMHALLNDIENRVSSDPDRYIATSFNKIKQGRQSLDNLVKMAKGDYMWKITIVVTKEAYKKRLRYPTFGADYYAPAPASWSERIVITIRIGDFTFYRSKK